MVTPFNIMLHLVMPKKLYIWGAVAAAGVSLASSALSSRAEGKQIFQQQLAQAKLDVGIDFKANRDGQSIIAAGTALSEQAIEAKLGLQLAQEKAESDAAVSAATAGVSGQSVDAVTNETEVTLAKAEGSLSRKVQSARLQLTQNFTDNFLNAELSKGKVDTTRSNKFGAASILNAGLAFGQAGGFKGLSGGDTP